MAAMPPMARRLAALARHVVGAGGSTTDTRTDPRRAPPALAPHTRPGFRSIVLRRCFLVGARFFLAELPPIDRLAMAAGRKAAGELPHDVRARSIVELGP